ncbi:MAG: type III pantothenate kinase [Acidobacteria bacterium]|nr:type III pantothenate kinase [Acidobacteriota bacterium]
MLLAIDIGNSATKFGVFDGERLVKRFTAPTIRGKSASEIFESIADEVDFRVERVVISSVVTELIEAFKELSEERFNQTPVIVDSTFDFGLKVAYDPPSNAGTDRLVAASSAVRKYGKPCIVCSFGTATTVDAVNSKGEFVGGAIAPGINTLGEALFLKTSKLPRVELVKPKSAIGDSTAECIQSGIFYGYVGLVRELITRIKHELGEPATVVATGGFVSLVAGEIDLLDHADELLILEGLRDLATER